MPHSEHATKRRGVLGWFDSNQFLREHVTGRLQQSDPVRWIPYLTLHAGCLGVIWVGWSWFAVGVAAALYLLRIFAITAFYHRYFSHRTFRTSRVVQFLFGVWGNSAAQRGPIWWASHHRQHHAFSDQPEDAHSPHQHGFYWAHIGWLTARDNLITNAKYVRDWLRFPELRFLDRFEIVVPVLLAVALFALGELLAATAPGLQTNGWQLVVWGFFISTVVVFHATCSINSIAHVVGKRRFETTDESRNNFWLALLTLGEGWHNNHHRFCGSTRQGFYWWEIDITYYVLVAFSKLGLIWDLRPVPRKILEDGLRRDREALA